MKPAHDSDLKQKTARGLLWGGLGNGLFQLLNLLFGIFLARLLSPHDYGMVGYLAIFVAIAGSIQECGFTNALINQTEIRHKDYNAAFWFTVLLGVSLYIILFFAAPLIAAFYHEPQLVPLARFLFLGFMISSTTAAHNAYMMKRLMVKQKTTAQVVALIVSGTISVSMAFKGFAYWGIATQTVSYVAVYALIMWIFSPWKPTLEFDFSPLRSFWRFSIKVLVTNIFNQINNNIFSVILGRFFTSRDVGYYTQASKWNLMGYSTLSGMIQGVAQPVLREVHDDKARQRQVFRKMLRFTAFASFPAMLGLALISHELIVITITDKWLISAQIMQMLCVWGAFFPITTLYTNMILSQGKSGVYMYGTIALGILQLIALLLTASHGIKVMILIFVGINIAWLFVWHHFVQKYINLRLWHAITDVAPFAIVAAITMMATHYITMPITNINLLLALKIVIAAVIYIATMKLLNAQIMNESIEYLFNRRKHNDSHI